MRREISFTSPYAALSIGVFGPDSIAVKSPADLTDQTVAVARGTTQDLKLTELAPNAKLQRYDDDAAAAAAFLSGQAQLLATADVVAKDRERLTELADKVDRLRAAIAVVGEITG